MSYILDALKKAEQERQREKVPTLATVHGGPVTPPRPIWPWIAAGVLLVNVAVLIWLVRATPTAVGTSTPPPSATVPQAPTAAVVPAPSVPTPESPTASVVAAPPLAPARPSPPETRVSPPAKPPVAAAPAPTAPPPSQPAPSAPSPVERRAMSTRPVESTAPAAPPPAPPRSADVRVPRRADAPVQAVPPVGGARTTGPTAEGPTPAAPARPVPLAERAAPPAVAPAPPASPSASSQVEGGPTPDVIGKMTVQMLVYSDVPTERLVFINNQKYLEGQAMDGGIVLERITQDGAVLTYQGKRFFVRAEQR